MTLDGTRTFVLGVERLAIIDPGPLLAEHLDAVADVVGSGVVTAILLTHTHPDHAEAAPALAARLGCEARAAATGTLPDGAVIPTDAGALHAVATPGHTPDHVSFWWPAEEAIFCGDLMMGGLDTALVARPEGDLGAYLDSLRRLAALEPRVIHPAHGPAFADPRPAIERYIRHRQERVAQVLASLADGPLSAAGLLEHVYGDDLDPRLRAYAESAIEAYLAYLESEQRVRAAPSGVWSLA